MGVAGLALFAPPIGGTVATGSFCIRDIMLLIVGTVAIGECLGIAAFTGGMTGAIGFGMVFLARSIEKLCLVNLLGKERFLWDTRSYLVML